MSKNFSDYVIFFSHVQKCPKFLMMFFFKSCSKLKNAQNFSTFSHAQKWPNFLKILHQYTDFAYLLLANYLRILIHPIIHFFTFLHCIQFFSYTSRKKLS